MYEVIVMVGCSVRVTCMAETEAEAQRIAIQLRKNVPGARIYIVKTKRYQPHRAHYVN